MTGNKFNKQQAGQVLLITIMLLATTLTVVITNTFKSITDTQITKLQEDSQKALAAAEAGIEKSLNEKSSGVIPNIYIGPGELNDIQDVTTTLSTITSNTYTTPLLTQDSQYTFYLADYPDLTSYWAGDLTLYFASETNIPALELVLVKSDLTFVRYIIKDTSLSFISGSNFFLPESGTYKLENITFKRKYRLSGISNSKLLIIRLLGASSKLGFEGSSELKKQGETISSQARTTTNIVKKVELRQSYPQIPAEFFVTSF